MVGDNAVDGNSTWPDGCQPYPGKLLTYPKSTRRWQDAQPNVCLYSWGLKDITNSVGPEMCFGRALVDSGFSTRVGFVPLAIGGTILANDWVPGRMLYRDIVDWARTAVAAAGPMARLRGMLFMEGEGTAMTQYNTPMNFIAAHWLTDFTSMVDALRVDLGLLNANLPVVLGVQRIAGRERVYPLMGIIKEQQQALNMSNLLKVQMEDKEMYPVDFTEIFGAWVGWQSIHFTKRGECDMGRDMAQTYMQAMANGELTLQS